MKHYIRKIWLRNTLTITFFILFLIIGISIGKAFASSNKQDQKPVQTQAPITSTTTTSTTTSTTTLPPTTTTTQKIVSIPPETTPKTEVSEHSGDWVTQCRAWAGQAGIELPDSAITLISRESKCDPNAQNTRSSAYGIGQFLDSSWKGVGCVKTSDPVEQLRCMNLYVVGRYGSWQAAKTFWSCRGDCPTLHGIVRNKTSNWY